MIHTSKDFASGRMPYLSDTPFANESELEMECYTLEESKARLKAMVHEHFLKA